MQREHVLHTVGLDVGSVVEANVPDEDRPPSSFEHAVELAEGRLGIEPVKGLSGEYRVHRAVGHRHRLGRPVDDRGFRQRAREYLAHLLEWFDEQSEEYRESVLPSAVTARVSVEAGLALSWHRYIGSRGRAVSIEHFGASADYQTLFREFGITTDAVVDAARATIAAS